MTLKQLKQGCMQTLDKNLEMLRKASNNVLWSFPEAASFICFIAAMHKWNSSAFFLSFAAITQLISSIPQITFLSSTLNFLKVSLIFTNTTLYSFYRWERLPTQPRSRDVISAPDFFNIVRTLGIAEMAHFKQIRWASRSIQDVSGLALYRRRIPNLIVTSGN